MELDYFRMALCYNYKTSALSVNALYEDLTTFTLIPYLDEYNKNISIKLAVENAMKDLKELNDDVRPILLGYVLENKLIVTNSDYADTYEIKVIENFVKELQNKDFPEILPEFIVFKCFPYNIDLPLQFGYIVNKYTEISKYNMYLLDKHQFVVVTELDFDFEDYNTNDILSDDFLEKLLFV